MFEAPHCLLVCLSVEENVIDDLYLGYMFLDDVE